MKISLILSIIISGLSLISSSASAQSTPSVLDDSIHSKILNEVRELGVVPPKAYQPGSSNWHEIVYVLDDEWYQELVPFIISLASSQDIFLKVFSFSFAIIIVRDRIFITK